VNNTLQRIGKTVIKDLEDLSIMGINYVAPCDAKSTGLPSESFDFITSSYVLEHMSSDDIYAAFRECHRLLRPDGVISCVFDLADHYWYTDKSISYYNFLQYSDKVWNMINSPIHFLNRLRFPDYKEILEKTGFKIVLCDLDLPTSEDINLLKNMDLNERFKKYSVEETGIKTAWLVLRKE